MSRFAGPKFAPAAPKRTQPVVPKFLQQELAEEEEYNQGSDEFPEDANDQQEFI